MRHARLFRHIKAEYRCTQCGCHRTVVENCISRLYVIVATVAGLPVVAAVLLRNEYFSWWYCVAAVIAGEWLALYAAAFISNWILAFEALGTGQCRQCGRPMFFAGRHFDPAGDEDAHYSDFVILGVFILLNVGFWVKYVVGRT